MSQRNHINQRGKENKTYQIKPMDHVEASLLT